MFYTILIFSANRHFVIVFIPLLYFWLSYTLPYIYALKKKGQNDLFSGFLGKEGVTCYETLQQLFDKV